MSVLTATQIAATFGYTTNHWAPALQAAAPDLPVVRLLAWIAEESGGNPAALGTSAEVGILQINTADRPYQFQSWTRQELHGTGAFAATATSQYMTRSLTSDEENTQVQAAVAYVRQCLKEAQSVVGGLGWSDADLWCAVKMRHALPAVMTDGWRQAQAAGSQYTASWRAFKGYMLSLQKSQLPTSLQPYASDLKFHNCELVGAADGASPDGTGTPGGQPLGIAAVDLLSALTIGVLIAIAYFFTR